MDGGCDDRQRYYPTVVGGGLQLGATSGMLSGFFGEGDIFPHFEIQRRWHIY